MWLLEEAQLSNSDFGNTSTEEPGHRICMLTSTRSNTWFVQLWPSCQLASSQPHLRTQGGLTMLTRPGQSNSEETTLHRHRLYSGFHLKKDSLISSEAASHLQQINSFSGHGTACFTPYAQKAVPPRHHLHRFGVSRIRAFG